MKYRTNHRTGDKISVMKAFPIVDEIYGEDEE